MQLNMALVRELKEEANRFRNAINGDSLSAYFGYLNFERGLFSQVQSLLNTGNLYRWFSIDELKKVQLASVKLSLSTGNFVNQNITQRRERTKSGENYDKLEAVQFANFVDGELALTERILSSFLRQFRPDLKALLAAIYPL